MAGGAGLTRDAMSLTSRTIEALRPAQAPYRVPDQRCVGLAIRVAPSGVKTWDLAFRIRGTATVRRLSLGRFTDVGLEKARGRANELTSAARTGRDLIVEEAEIRAAAALRITVEQLIALYLRRRVSGRLRTATEIERRLKRSLASILHRHAGDIRRRDIRQLLDDVAERGIEREAEKRRQTAGAMFRWALSQDIIENDPTAGLKTYDRGTPRDRLLSADEIKVLWEWLENGDLPPDAADILKLQLSTGARCGEISGLRAEEINCLQWMWTLPATRSKNKRARVTPIVGIARRIVEARLAEVPSGPLFTSETGIPLTSSHIGHHILARIDKLPINKFTTHDLRRTVATFLTEMGTSLDLVATVVGHEPGGSQNRTLVRHYIRTDLIERKKTVLEAWDRRLHEIVEGSATSGNIRRIEDAWVQRHRAGA
jgi:integrase